MNSSKIIFAQGVKASIHTLTQRRVYAGLLEGLPTKERNDAVIESLGKRPRTYLVMPSQTPIDIGRPYPFGTPAELPVIECIASLSSRSWNGDPTFTSSGDIVWFQESWAMPIDPEVLEHLQGVVWRSFAIQCEI